MADRSSGEASSRSGEINQAVGGSAVVGPQRHSPFLPHHLSMQNLPSPHGPGSGSQLDLTGASLSLSKAQPVGGAPPIVLPHQEPEYINHIAIDAGGSLIKLVYLSQADEGFGHPQEGSDEEGQGQPREGSEGPESREEAPPEDQASGRHSGTGKGGRLHFVKFEASNLDACFEFIRSKGLHHSLSNGEKMRVKATGGGAYRFADAFKEKLGLLLEREDEMECLVDGANFLLKTIRYEAFTFEQGKQHFVSALEDEQLYPYLLVNIGSGVSIVKVDGEGSYERVSGTNLGGGTFWGLCRLLTKCRGFDEMLELAMHGDNSKVDMLVGDIYGGGDYSKAGLSATTIASSFGKVVMSDKDLEDYEPADIALALCRMVSYNIGQLAFLNAQRYGMKRVFFGGFFIRGLQYTMETISFAINFWSKGELTACFLRHEGFLGAMGAFLKSNPMSTTELMQKAKSSKIKAKFMERFSMGAPFVGGKVHGEAIKDVSSKVSWVEKFVQVGTKAANNSGLDAEGSSAKGSPQQPAEEEGAAAPSPRLQLDLHVGVLHFTPSLEPFPLVANPGAYDPNTIDINEDEDERQYWLRVLEDSVPTLVRKAVLSAGGTAGAQRRGDAFGKAFKGHLSKLREEPSAYGRVGLADLLEMREECLREFSFTDAYKLDKLRENEVALEVLPDLLAELDGMAPRERLLALVEGVLAANIFDWGAQACVDLYNNGTILEIYRKARADMGRRPWRVDTFDGLCEQWFRGRVGPGGQRLPSFGRVVIFVDNAGADAVLGMLPLARELLRNGSEVVMVANSQPAINDLTTSELRSLVRKAGAICPIIAEAREAANRATAANDSVIPPPPGVPSRRQTSEDADLEHKRAGDNGNEPRLYISSSGHGSPCLDLRRVPEELADAAAGTDLVIIEGMGRAIHTNLYCTFTCPSLKLAMVKNARIAKKLFNGNLYDCICLYEPGAGSKGAAKVMLPPPLPASGSG